MEGQILNRVTHVMVPVKKLSESIEWYTSNLGFNVKWKRNDNKMAILELPQGPHFFLRESRNETNAHFLLNDDICPVIGLEAKDIRRLLEDLKNKGVQIGEVREERGEGMDFDFYDINGNMLVAHEPFIG
ncbi:VOC family protein [Paenibacillus terrigena]|uniref:VOC family protein n=1 Tax=Paenibacillus terrigena TaxID=369333 RepID=UPI0028D619E2|nr:VOC family protein [Paenibacillus terrigena]